ncbi:MAG: putative porin, partial [Bacteroidales bacterium]|nr:putative porin [Bacteroidales bacterium]
MRLFLSILTATLLVAAAKAQTGTTELVGKVSFVSSRNIYVKFKSTEGINIGDTLFVPDADALSPALVVTGLSSVSCLCTVIADRIIAADHLVVARIKDEKMAGTAGVPAPAEKSAAKPVMEADTVISPKQPERRQNVRGTISVNSYTDFSDTDNPVSQRFRYTLSLSASQTGGSGFSFETYVSFRHKYGEWEYVKDNIFNALKIYNLSARYDFNKTTSLLLGRKINPMISSAGSMDGLQFEKAIGNFSFGVVAGSRPDYEDYGFNPSLFQYGAWIGYSTRGQGRSSRSSVAYFEQTNDFSTDRRFIYFQHSNDIIRNVSFFTSAEVDLFRIENNAPVTTLDLTGLYLSLSYRLPGKFSVSAAYDARKNVIYYETYKSFTDRILEEGMRQGYRLYGNWRLTRKMNFGLQAGYRFLKSDLVPTKSINGYYTYTNMPGLNMTATLSGSYMMTSHSDLAVGGIDLRRDFAGGRFQSGIGYSYVMNSLTEGNITFVQHMGELNFSWYILEKLSLSANYEGTFESV